MVQALCVGSRKGSSQKQELKKRSPAGHLASCQPNCAAPAVMSCLQTN